MFTNSLDTKPIITNKDGEDIVDLTSSMFKKDVVSYSDGELYKVPREYEMRPDLISQAVYGTPDKAEIILKYNEYSNPFSIKVFAKKELQPAKPLTELLSVLNKM